MTTSPALPHDRIAAAIAEYQAGKIQAAELAERVLVAEAASAQTSADQRVRIDVDRQRRCGWPEVIYAAGKTADDLHRAVDRSLDARLAVDEPAAEVFITRISVEQAAYLGSRYSNAAWDAVARTMRVRGDEGEILSPERLAEREPPRVNVIAAGTADTPVAAETRQTLAWMGVPSRGIFDVGVAGLYRLLGHLPSLRAAQCNIVIAGMEGALASVVGGLVATPVIAVPTSIGYGANLQGVAALLTMLNGCTANVCVVNIDAGFKAGFLAASMLRAADVAESSGS